MNSNWLFPLCMLSCLVLGKGGHFQLIFQEPNCVVCVEDEPKLRRVAQSGLGCEVRGSAVFKRHLGD